MGTFLLSRPVFVSLCHYTNIWQAMEWQCACCNVQIIDGLFFDGCPYGFNQIAICVSDTTIRDFYIRWAPLPVSFFNLMGGGGGARVP